MGDKAKIQDKHQKLDALAKQQQEFDKKRKMLAQDAFVAKLKLKHEQERQMLLLKQGKKVQTSEHMLSALKGNPAFAQFQQAAKDADDAKEIHGENVKKKTLAIMMS